MKQDSIQAAKVLWKLAYNALDDEDAEVLNSNAGRHADLNSILAQKALREKKLQEWTIQFAKKPIKIKSICEKIISFIDFSKDYLSQVAALEPNAAIAWTCIASLLPIIANAKDQNEAMLTGLDRVSYLVGLYTTWEALYVTDATEELRGAVVKLYTAVLTYQARLLHYLSKGSVSRGIRKATKYDDWEQWLAEVNLRHDQCEEHSKLADISRDRQHHDYQEALMNSQLETAKQMLQELKFSNQKRLNEISEEKRTMLLQSLSSDYNRQKNVNPERVKGTCEWLANDPRFLDWTRSQGSQLLHVFAGPGCGKSVLTRYLIDSKILQTSEDTRVLFFFFKDKQAGQDRCADAIAAVLHQLYSDPTRQHLMVHAVQKYDAHGPRLSTMFDDLWEILEKSIKDPSSGEIFCLFDALDECIAEDRGRILAKVAGYFSDVDRISDGGGRLKMLITSRPYGEISTEYEFLGSGSQIVQLDGADKSDLIAEEINLVIEDKVPRLLPKLGRDIQCEIIQELQRFGNRTYLWLYLVLDFIKRNIAGNRTTRKIKGLIARLPPDVSKAYTEMLRRSTDINEARRLLSLVVAARRPLTVSEINVANALGKQEYGQYQNLVEETEDPEDFKNSLQDLCGLMLTVHDSHVYLVHQTVRTYLCEEPFQVEVETGMWAGPIQMTEAELLMAQACTSLLTLDDFQVSFPIELSEDYGTEIEGIRYKWAEDYEFMTYAAEHWISHSACLKQPEDMELLRQQAGLCNPERDIFVSWFAIYGPLNSYCEPKRSMSDISPESALSVACHVGHAPLVKLLVGEGDDVNELAGLSPLKAACHYGNEATVKILLDHGAAIHAECEDWHPIIITAMIEASGVMRTFLEQDKDLTDHIQIYVEGMVKAAEYGNRATVEVLLDHGVSINAKSESGDDALGAAADTGQEHIVDLLLARGADVNARIEVWRNALQSASGRGFASIVKTLIAHGADVNARGMHYGTALQAASGNGHVGIVEFLIAHGADVNASAQGGTSEGAGNALQAASLGGHLNVVEILIAHGADVKAQGGDYGNALQAASYHGHVEVLEVLIAHGADVNTQGGNWGNALQAASSRGEADAVEMLLARGADVNAQGGEYGNALQAASTSERLEVVESLIAHGADVNATGGLYSTALQAAALMGSSSVVKALIAHGADVNIQGGYLGSALAAASARRDDEIADILRSHGARELGA